MTSQVNTTYTRTFQPTVSFIYSILLFVVDMTEGNVNEVKMNTRVDLPSYKSFEIIGSDTDETAARWKKWKRGLEFYIEAIGIDKTQEKARLKNMILYLIGEDCQDIYATLNDTGDDYISVLNTLNTYFVPPCNLSFERHIFNSCKQEKGGNMDAYVTRLRALSKTCDFGDGVDERLIKGSGSAGVLFF